MTRIVDVRRMLMSLRLQELLCVCFTVTDSAIEENNRTLVLTGTEISGAMLMDGKPENSEGEITDPGAYKLCIWCKDSGRTL